MAQCPKAGPTNYDELGVCPGAGCPCRRPLVAEFYGGKLDGAYLELDQVPGDEF